MKTTFLKCILFIACLMIAQKHSAQNVPEWVKDINTLPDTSNLFPVRVLNDATNHTLVLSSYSKQVGLGIFERKIYLNKYHETGGLMWTLVYDNNGTGGPAGADMALDASGNCYIAGRFTDPLEKPLLLKVNTSGSIVWQRDSTTAFQSSGYSQVIFQNDRLYLKAWEGITTFDVNGNEIWSLGNMNAERIAVDGAGQMIVSATQSGTNHTVFRYDATGILNFSDSTILAKRIAPDVDNNFYLLADIPQYVLVKYNNTGAFAWSWIDFPPMPGFGDIGFDVLTDYHNDVIVVGLADTMFKFTTSGNLVWEQSMNGLDNYLLPARIVFDNFVAIAGTVQGGSGYDMKVAFFNLYGIESWSGYYNSNDIQEFPVDIAIDNSGVYVVEDNQSNTTLVKFTTPYASSIDFDLACVDSVWYDPLNPIFINVQVFNGNVSHINYPSVQIVSPAGDTVSNLINFVNFFAHLGNGHQVYTDTIVVAGITDFIDYTFIMHEGLGSTSEIIDWCFATGISNSGENGFHIFPNPVNKVLYIENKGKLNKNFIAAIYSVTGMRMYEETLSSEALQEIDVSGFASGMYILKVTDGNSSWQVKVVKE